jgi:8-oxo-dGTP diphosphatase
MIVFQDMYQNEVQLSFSQNPFSDDPKHVWVICQYKEKWLLTRHRERGLEFPGGKVEVGESPEDAAIREVKEETGGDVENLTYLGQYKVLGRGKTIVKNIYFAKINSLTNQSTYFETYGPELLTVFPTNISQNRNYSFIMKDEVLTYSLKEVEKSLAKKLP